MIHIKPTEAPTFFASKWQHIDLLVEASDFEELFQSTSEPIFLFSTMGLQPKDKNCISHSDFLSAWERYTSLLKEGEKVVDAEFRFFFTLALSYCQEAVRVLDFPDGRETVVPYAPIVQMQMHRMSYSVQDGKFHSQAFGPESISWGVRLSYPQLYQDPIKRSVENGFDEAVFVNARLFSRIRSWVRRVSLPVHFTVNGAKIMAPCRLGRDSFRWIDKHPDLVRKQLTV